VYAFKEKYAMSCPNPNGILRTGSCGLNEVKHPADEEEDSSLRSE
jgi:hypothetical protein